MKKVREAAQARAFLSLDIPKKIGELIYTNYESKSGGQGRWLNRSRVYHQYTITQLKQEVEAKRLVPRLEW